MATYYWLGLSAGASGATHNCNIVSNWSLWGPGASGASGATLPVSSTSVPGYNDSVVFCKFGTFAPLHPPFGQMIGVSGPAGNTGAQFFLNIGVSGDYPLSLGTGGLFIGEHTDDISGIPQAKPFTFAAQTLTLNSTSGAPTNFPGSLYNVIGLKDNVGITKENTTITYNNFQVIKYKISGTAKTIKRSTLNQNGENSRFNLTSMSFSSPGYGIDASGSTVTAATNFNVGPNTSINGSIALQGNYVQCNISKGFALAQTDTVLELRSSPNSSQQNIGPVLFFMPEFGSGQSGPDYVSRTYIEKLRTTTSNSTVGEIYVQHGVDLNILEQDGSNIQFSADLGGNTNISIVQEGTFNNSNSSITIKNATAQLGSNGNFIIHNVDPSQRINITPISTDGSTTYNLDLNPISGWTGV